MNTWAVQTAFQMKNRTPATRRTPALQVMTRRTTIPRMTKIKHPEIKRKEPAISRKKIRRIKIGKFVRKPFHLKARTLKTNTTIKPPITKRRNPKMNVLADRISPSTLRIVPTQRKRTPKRKSPRKVKVRPNQVVKNLRMKVPTLRTRRVRARTIKARMIKIRKTLRVRIPRVEVRRRVKVSGIKTRRKRRRKKTIFGP